MRGFHTLKKKKNPLASFLPPWVSTVTLRNIAKKTFWGMFFSLNSGSFLKEDYTKYLHKSPLNLYTSSENHGLSVTQVTTVCFPVPGLRTCRIP